MTRRGQPVVPASVTPGRPWRHGYVAEHELYARPKRRARRRDTSPGRTGEPQRTREDGKQSGVALVLVIIAIAVMAVFVTDLIENTSSELHIATGERDRLKAEYLARSGLNLTRLLIAAEPAIRQVVAMPYQMVVGRRPPQLNVWDFADTLLAPFADYESAKALGAESGIDFNVMGGVKDTGGTFEVITVPENSKINLNSPLFFSGDDGRTSTAMQLFALLGGYQSPESPYDPMFSALDPDGHYTTRLDIVSNMIDWWDDDEQRTVFDPGSAKVTSGGSEDNIYGQLADSYGIKNAPFDSIDELRLIRGVGDDFWSTFVESDPDDPKSRKVTIYASGAVNVNLAAPEVLLARLCSFVSQQQQPLCNQPTQVMAFIELFRTARAMLPIPLFSTPDDFLNFVSGTPTQGIDLYAALKGLLGEGSLLMAWQPLVIAADQRRLLAGKFLTDASIFTIQATGRVGRSTAKMTLVVNFDRSWTPPKGVPGSLPSLGVPHYFRLE
jgi:general secretion pathway protein K